MYLHAAVACISDQRLVGHGCFPDHLSAVEIELEPCRATAQAARGAKLPHSTCMQAAKSMGEATEPWNLVDSGSHCQAFYAGNPTTWCHGTKRLRRAGQSPGYATYIADCGPGPSFAAAKLRGIHIFRI